MEKDILAETQELEQYWGERNAQMLIDRDIINLVKDEKEKSDKTKWKDNEPKVLYDTAVSLMSSYPTRFRFPLSINFTDEERQKMNKAERFVLGIFRALNRRQLFRGQNAWDRELCYWVCSGMVPVFAHVERDGKDVKFLADIFDPMTVYPKWDADGLTKLVRTYEVNKITAESMAEGWKQKGLEFQLADFGNISTVKVINYWLDDRGKIYNAILLGGQVVKPLTKEPFKRIPFIIGTVGVPDKISAGWGTRYFENIIAANRDMFDYTNTMVSLMATIMAETAYPNLVSKTRTGTPIMDRVNKGYGEEIPLKLEESIEILKHATTPQEVNVLMQWTNKQKQKGGFSDVVYGGVMFETSGFALSQLMATLKYKLSPYLNLKDTVTPAVASELVEQYRDGDFPPVVLSTVDPKGIRKGLSFIEEYSRRDVPERTFIEATTPITSAIDKTQQILFARQAMQPPQLLSRETIWDELLDVQDSDQEYARIIQDEILEDPIMKQIAVIEQLKQKEMAYRDAGKTQYADSLRNYILRLEMQIGLGQNIAAAKPPGVGPAEMPPEMLRSPDMMGAALGKGPPGVNRPPQNNEMLGMRTREV